MTLPRARGLVAIGLAALVVAGCGQTGRKGSSLVDASQRILINSLDVDPDNGQLLLTTNRGFFRIVKGKPRRIDGTVRTPDGAAHVGTFLAIKALGHGRLIGSGHPNRKGKVASFLGFLRSEDNGRHWRIAGRYGLTDLHVLRIRQGRLYAYDAVLPGLLESDNGGKSFKEKATPPGLIIDAVVDPDDGNYLLASNAKEIFRSTDGGNSWRSITPASSGRLEWPRHDALYRADSDGRVYRSKDRGESWEPVGTVDGEPWKLKALGPDDLYAALSDATVVHSTDGGRSWQKRFVPP